MSEDTRDRKVSILCYDLAYKFIWSFIPFHSLAIFISDMIFIIMM